MQESRLANDLEKRVKKMVEESLRREHNEFEAKLRDLEYFKLKALAELKRMSRELDSNYKTHLTELKRLNSQLERISKKLR